MPLELVELALDPPDPAPPPLVVDDVLDALDEALVPLASVPEEHPSAAAEITRPATESERRIVIGLLEIRGRTVASVARFWRANPLRHSLTK